MEKIKIKVLKGFYSADNNRCKPGEVYEFPDYFARELINHKRAVEYTPQVQKQEEKQLPKVEVTSKPKEAKKNENK